MPSLCIFSPNSLLLGFSVRKTSWPQWLAAPLNSVFGSCPRPPLVVLVLAVVLLLFFGRTGQPCVLLLSSWCLQWPCYCSLAVLAKPVSSSFPPLVLFLSSSCPPVLAVVLLLSSGQPCVLLLSSWCLQLSCCRPVAALANLCPRFVPSCPNLVCIRSYSLQVRDQMGIPSNA